MWLLSCTRAELLCINCSTHHGTGALNSLVCKHCGTHRQLHLKIFAHLSEVISERERVWNLIQELGKCSSACLSQSYTQTPFNKMLVAREFCSQPGMWVIISTDSLLCMRVRLQLPAFSLLHLAATELQHVSQPFYFTVWAVCAPLAAVPSTLSNHLKCHSSQWNRFHAPVAVTLPGNGSITQLRHSAF